MVDQHKENQILGGKNESQMEEVDAGQIEAANNSEASQYLLNGTKPHQAALETSNGTSDDETTYNVGFLTLLVSISTIGGFLFGYDTSIIAGAQLYFEQDWPDISHSQIAFIVSIALFGAAIGALFSGSISDQYGRKPVILAAAILFTLGSIVMAVAPSIGILMLGRLIIGLGVGISSQIAPLYLSEVAPVEIRGKLVALNVAMITFAQFVSAIICFLARPNWRGMIGGIAFLSVLQFVCMLFMPESPRWLGKEGRNEEQLVVMRKIYKPAHIDRVNSKLTEEVSELSESTNLTIRIQLKLLCSVYSRPLLIGCSILALQQLNGINTAMYFGPLIMQKAGIKIEGMSKNESSLVLNIPIAFCNFVGTLICVFMIERLGRRAILLLTLPIIAVCWVTAAIGMSFTGDESSETAQTVGGYVTIFAICLFVFVFAVGMSATPWAISSEIYPLHVIGTAMSLGALMHWVANALVAEVFKLVSEVSLTATVMLYIAMGGIAVGTYIFVYKFVPETAGKPISDILDNLLGKGYKDQEKAVLKQEKERTD